MNKKSGIILILIILSVLGIVFLKKKPKTIAPPLPINDKNEQSFLIDGFPIKEVPLYKLNKVSSNKIFVNTDPKNTSGFDETNFAYFNVVFYSDASQEEFLNYYKNLFDSQIKEEFASPDMVKGNIGQYKVSAAHYGSENTGYLQVHLPIHNDEGINKYFVNFPDVFKINPNTIEHEKSYGLLNQKGGEIEYTKYFTVTNSGDKDNDGKDDVDEFLLLETEYQELYKQQPEYSYDEKTGTMKWRNGEYEITLAITRDHGRIYLMLRKKINQ
ncbi:MAG: hypothetical protein WC503_05980 [Candidatus Shapirobacteria bacterium]